VKLLYFSSDGAEVDLLFREFLAAGIPCEVRRGPFPEGMFPSEGYAELWIERDRDWHRALMLCVELDAECRGGPVRPQAQEKGAATPHPAASASAKVHSASTRRSPKKLANRRAVLYSGAVGRADRLPE